MNCIYYIGCQVEVKFVFIYVLNDYTFMFYCKMFFAFIGKEETLVFLSDSHADDDAFEIGKTTIARSRYD